MQWQTYLYLTLMLSNLIKQICITSNKSFNCNNPRKHNSIYKSNAVQQIQRYLIKVPSDFASGIAQKCTLLINALGNYNILQFWTAKLDKHNSDT